MSCTGDLAYDIKYRMLTIHPGWTLQELIAPAAVQFYGAKWRLLGTKAGLSSDICCITGISADILSKNDLSTASVASRMSWASNRETTRKEDEAYCLLGMILGPNFVKAKSNHLGNTYKRWTAFLMFQDKISNTPSHRILVLYLASSPDGRKIEHALFERQIGNQSPSQLARELYDGFLS